MVSSCKHITRLAFAVFLSLASSTATFAQGMSKVMVNGVPVRVYGAMGQGYAVVAGTRAVIQGDSILAILGIFAGNGRTYVMVTENCGGSGCGDVFRAIDMSDDVYRVSPVFGTGVVGAKPEVQDGALILTQKTADGTATFHYAYKDGKLVTEKEMLNLDAAGPETAPGGDMAALANGKPMSAIFKMRATAKRLQDIMGKDFEDARSVALHDFGGGFVEKNGLMSAGVCQPHECNSHSLSVSFDHEGHVWASLVRNNARTFYGNPNPLVRVQLTN